MNLKNSILKKFSNTARVRLWGLTKVPLLWFIRPSVTQLDETTCIVKIPFIKRNKNHLGSMYFGVLCAAADIAGGLAAMNFIDKSEQNVTLVFKDFKAEFLKRVEGECYFINTQGREIKDFVQKVIDSGERMNMPLYIEAKVPDKLGDEIVAKFTLGLSLKLKK